MVSPINGFIASYYLQVKRFWRSKSRVIGSIVQPVFWMIFFGIGFTKSVRLIGPAVSYIDFLIPGVILMTIFTASFMGGMSVIWDKEFGFMKVVLVSPAPRQMSLLGRIMGDATIALFQGLIISLVAYPLTSNLNYLAIPIVLGVAFLVSISVSSIGITIASKMRSFEGFGLIVNLISMPLTFASGVFFPIDTMPDWMKIIAYISPLTYGADIARSLMLGISSMDIMTDIFALSILTIMFVSMALIIFEKTTIE